MCPNCDFLIWASKGSCKKCGAKRPGSETSGGRGKGGRKKKYGKSDGGEWICSNCSSSNYADRDKCRKCKTDRPDTKPSESTVEPGAITADKTKPKKEKKDKKKKNKGGDDWTCNSCKTSNFSDREQCRKCNNPRPGSADDDNDAEEKKADSNETSIKLNVEIELKLKEIQETNKLDVDMVFLMDCTGSMSAKINAGKQAIKNIINELKSDKNNNINSINFGYIAYRDQPKSESSFITKVYPLTDDVNKMYEYINSYGASGGGDGPEALTEALHDSLTKIKYNDNNIKINILICDAPGHGWGCTSYDTYPKGNPNGYDPIALCHSMARQGIILYVLGCEPSISYYKNARDILEGMSKITEGFYLPLTNADLLPDIICKSLKQEINLKYIEKFIINMMINIRSKTEKNNEGISDEGQLLDNIDMDLVKKLKMENKIETGNIYDGEYDYFNINLIKNTEDDEKKQNIKYVVENIKKDLKQPRIKRFSAKSKFDMKSGDWNCTKCHYHNFANRWFCRTCNNINHTLKNGDWLCTKCDDINFAKNKVCRKCKVTKRPTSGPNIINKKKENDEKKESKQKVDGVKCAVNDDIFGVVINRIKKQHKFHDWKCKSCKYINFEANDKCRKCGITKSDNFGDWKCNKCTFMNFGIRKNCKRCNQSKPT